MVKFKVIYRLIYGEILLLQIQRAGKCEPHHLLASLIKINISCEMLQTLLDMKLFKNTAALNLIVLFIYFQLLEKLFKKVNTNMTGICYRVFYLKQKYQIIIKSCGNIFLHSLKCHDIFSTLVILHKKQQQTKTTNKIF